MDLKHPLTFDDIIIEVTEGRITPGEGSSLSDILTANIRNIESDDLARRLATLESRLDEIRRYKHERAQILAEAAHEPEE